MNKKHDSSVLIVDDEATSRNMLVRRLKRHGFSPTDAASGQSALDRVKETHFDAILLDLMMPGLSGIETLKKLRELFSPVELPVIMVTAVPDSDQVVAALEAGANDYVVKPVDFKMLVARLKTQIALKRAEDRALESRGELERLVWERTRELEDSQRLLQTVFDAIPHHLFVKDLQGRYLMFNRNFEESWGMKHNEGKSYSTSDLPLAGGNSVEQIKAIDHQVASTGEAVFEPAVEFRVKGSQPQIRRQVKVPLRNEHGEIHGIVGISEDITQQVEAHKVSKDNERLLQTIFDTFSLPIFVKDMEKRYIKVNKAFEELHGVTEEEILGLPISQVSKIDPVEGVILEAQDDEVLSTGKENTLLEQEVTDGEGKKRIRVIRKAPLRDGEGNIIGLVGLSEDITERRETEAALRQAQKMEAIGQLTGGVAHDFNNLLQVIRGYTQMAIVDMDVRETSVDHLNKVIQASDRAGNLTRQLLAFSRQGVLEPTYLDINNLIQNLEKMVRILIGVDIQLKIECGENPRPLHADPGMIEQVLLNLCINARDAMPAGGTLSIQTLSFTADEEFCRIHAWENPGHYSEIVVSDTGSGMTDEVRGKIFDPFFTTKEPGKGTGLGLAMVYGIVQQHKGKIMVYSEPGQGAAFRLFLPTVQAEDFGMMDIQVEPVRGGSETILIAEDSAEVLGLVTRLLEDVGYGVTSAANGLEALEKVDSHPGPIDLVMLDLVMPKMGGRETYDRIKKQYPDLAVLFTTGYSAMSIDAEFLSRENLRLIQKPYLPNDLYRVVREVLDRR